MGGVTGVDLDAYVRMSLGGEPTRVYTLYWREDRFLFDHKNTVHGLDVAIERVEDAMLKLRKENGIEKITE